MLLTKETLVALYSFTEHPKLVWIVKEE